MSKAYRYIFAAALAVGLTLPFGSAVSADHDYAEACHERLQAQKAKIDRDIERYGEHSAKVDHDVAKLEDERAWCRNHHAEWDHKVFDFGVYVHH